MNVRPTSHSGLFTPGQEPTYAIIRRLGGPSESKRFGEGWNIFLLTRFELRTVQPVFNNKTHTSCLCVTMILKINTKYFRCMLHSPPIALSLALVIYREYILWSSSHHQLFYHSIMFLYSLRPDTVPSTCSQTLSIYPFLAVPQDKFHNHLQQ
jgi:hypothetical protein